MCMAFGTRLIYVEYSKSGEEVIEMTLGEKIKEARKQAGLSQE